MRPLVLGGPPRLIWNASDVLERLPGLIVVATAIELVATAPR
jgi:hypothetical protein